jgi:hypothetical protein
MWTRQNNGRRKVSSPDFIAEISAKIESDRRMTIWKLAAAHANYSNDLALGPGPVKKVC